MHPSWLSNTYLIADRDGGSGALVDAGGPVAPLLAAAEEHGVTLTHVLLTHHHADHVAELALVLERNPDVAVLISPLERELVGAATGTIEPDREIAVGDLRVRALATPGHTAGMLAFLVDDSTVFTGDTLFRHSVGGVRAPGSTSYEDLRESIMETLMRLDRRTEVLPGHSDPTTIAEEWEHNPFIRIWRGIDREGSEPCRALGEPATLVLLGDDYDGGHKAWVRWPDGRDDIVPGSRVEPGD